MCCMQLAENTGRKNYPQNRHLGIIAQFCQAMSLQLRYMYQQSEKSLFNSNISFTCPRNMVNVCPVTAEISW